MDDIFGAAPATDDVDDLFGAPPAEAETDVDDLFGVPVSEPADAAPAAAPADESVDDLFGLPENNAAPEASVDDLFGAAPAAPAVEPEKSVHVVSSDVPQVKSLADTKIRTWIDNSGQFHTDGRLFEINKDNVRLYKTNGRTCTVPHHRLSEADAAYVESIQKQIEAARLAMLTSK